uniref:AIP/AIPL N-terminal FKBP-type PPIase domain-containing protein n=1 Tax=Clastoptera arizonana TaxID=38151 RepID=A0A1B6DV55_9HEMI
MDPSLQSEAKIKKTVLHVGKNFKPCGPGSKVTFHFQTRLCDCDNTMIDNSYKMKNPMQLVLGKNFKLEVWETIVQKMAVKEVAKFVVDKSLVTTYPFVSKTLRDVDKPNHVTRSHCCGTTLQNEGIGYEDLNKLLKQPQDLEFTIEIIDIENVGEYKQESWQMTEEEKINAIPKMHEQANDLYKVEKYKDAAQIYAQAIGFLEQLMLKEKPKDVEWIELNQKKIPLLLNYAQCQFKLGEFYDVIEHSTTVLEFEPDNVKAIFRRAKAHAAVWNIAEAKSDFERVLKLNPKLKSTVTAELDKLNEEVRKRDSLDRQKLKGKIF